MIRKALCLWLGLVLVAGIPWTRANETQGKLGPLEKRIRAYQVHPAFSDDRYGLLVVKTALQALKEGSGGARYRRRIGFQKIRFLSAGIAGLADTSLLGRIPLLAIELTLIPGWIPRRIFPEGAIEHFFLFGTPQNTRILRVTFLVTIGLISALAKAIQIALVFTALKRSTAAGNTILVAGLAPFHTLRVSTGCTIGRGGLNEKKDP
ncbi:MAG: hypothetical protein KKC20_07795 [Proteobacteria bacterium]|nr:hypothetical protein [Pseudomonadota bacterium]